MPPPNGRRGERAVSYKICSLFTQSICYWEVHRHCSGKGNFLRGGEVEKVPWGECSMDSEVSGNELSRGNSAWGTLPEFLYRIIFIYLTFSLAAQFYN